MDYNFGTEEKTWEKVLAVLAFLAAISAIYWMALILQ